MIAERERQLDELLEAAIGSFDIPDHLYELAVRRYEDVGDWLSNSADRRGTNGEVYVQGSFRLGTVTQPIGSRDEYDIDMVDRRDLSKASISQAKLKMTVGADLSAYVSACPEGHPQCDEGKRCWTLEYPSDPFHIDVLPAIPDPDGSEHAILVTDRDLRAWQHSNPIGYSEWFRARMATEFVRRREAAALSMKAASIEDVPEWRVKTTLQRTVQALKRHRDLYFQDRVDHRPASIIITTLAARSYIGGGTLHEVLVKAVAATPQLVEKRDGQWWVPNPVQSEENFADRWREHPELADAFFEWAKQARIDFASIVAEPGLDRVLKGVANSLGRDAADAAGATLGTAVAGASSAGQLGLGSAAGVLSTTPRRPAPGHTFHGGDAAPRLL